MGVEIDEAELVAEAVREAREVIVERLNGDRDGPREPARQFVGPRAGGGPVVDEIFVIGDEDQAVDASFGSAVPLVKVFGLLTISLATTSSVISMSRLRLGW